MFGYVRMYKPELKMREYDHYQGVYCSLCKRIGKRYGAALRLTLSYDMTFLALLYMALQPTCAGFTRSRCSYHLLKKCLQCSETEALDFAADTAALLCFYRCRDSLQDETFFGSFRQRLFLPFARRYHRRARMRLPEVDESLTVMMAAQRDLEAQKTFSIDAAAEPFAQFMQGLFAALSSDVRQQTVLSRFGYCLGRYVYLADAAEDLIEDGHRGRYNPFIYNRRLDINDRAAITACQQYAADVLRHCQAECIAAYNLLEIYRFDGILRNVLEPGITQVIAHLFDKKTGRKQSV